MAELSEKLQLQYACFRGDLDKVKLLVDQGLSLEDKSEFNLVKFLRSDNNLPFHSACEYGHLDIVKYLIEQGLDLNDKSEFNLVKFLRSNNNYALRIAYKNEHLDIIRHIERTIRNLKLKQRELKRQRINDLT